MSPDQCYVTATRLHKRKLSLWIMSIVPQGTGLGESIKKRNASKKTAEETFRKVVKEVLTGGSYVPRSPRIKPGTRWFIDGVSCICTHFIYAFMSSNCFISSGLSADHKNVKILSDMNQSVVPNRMSTSQIDDLKTTVFKTHTHNVDSTALYLQPCSRWATAAKDPAGVTLSTSTVSS